MAQATPHVVIIGAGAGGLAVAASLLKRQPALKITVCDPATHHYYQPGWTMVGAGVFEPEYTQRALSELIPNNVTWLQQAVHGFHPERNSIELSDQKTLDYDALIVAPGLTLHWQGIEGLEETLGQNGVTSNYRYDLAPYTWQLVQEFKRGKAIFTQPPMPIKCAGAPQKALYLSCDYWLKHGVLNDIDASFYNAAGVLFGVADYVPALKAYIERYHVDLQLNHNLVKVDGLAKKAWFKPVSEKEQALVETEFDFLHVCPPQKSPDFIEKSPLANAAGWLDVDQATLKHSQFDNVFGLGDVIGAPNAKTAAAVRKQAPVVAENVLATLSGRPLNTVYDGYGSCPLTVERGKIVLAEFGYGGKLLPTFPSWLNDGFKPTGFAWWLKAFALPHIYWHCMLKGREWLAAPKHSD